MYIGKEEVELEIVQVSVLCFICRKKFKCGDKFSTYHEEATPSKWDKMYPKRLRKWYRDCKTDINLLVHEECLSKDPVTHP